MKKNAGLYKVIAVIILLVTQGCAGIIHNVRSKIYTTQDEESLVVTTNPYAISVLPPVAKEKKPVAKDSGLSRPSSVIVFANTYIINDSVKMKHDMGEVKLSNWNDFYVAEQSKPGYFHATTLLGRTLINPWKIVDIALPVIFDVALFTSPGQGNNLPSYITPFAVLYAIGGFVPIGFGSWKTYKTTYQLPALQPIPQKEDKENDFYVRSVNITDKTDSSMRFVYPKYGDFAHNHPKYSGSDQHGQSVREELFSGTLNKTLASWKYIDTSKHGLAYLYDRTMYMKCDVSSVAIYTVGQFTSFDVTSKWRLYSPAGGNAIYEANYESSSVWTYYTSDATGYINFTCDALSRSLAKFMQEDKVQNALHNQNYATPNVQVWDTLKMSTSDSGRVSKLSDAIKAGVTVKSSNGNASGCIISADGYVVTNYHVAGADTAKEVKLISSKGDTLMATRVRNNISYDLALLKIKRPGSYKYFIPETSKDIPLGMDVYAVGTPAEVELGQTISKGIISGQRKAGTKKIIQTDVAISPGNNGGALVNDKGGLIGIVNAKFIGEGIQGIGFAIPAYYLEEALKIKFAR